MSVITQINLEALNLITMNRCKVCSTPVLQRKKRKKLGSLSTNCCIKKLVDLGYVCLTCYRTVEKCSSLESVLLAKLSGRANDPSALESSGTKRRATPTEHAAAVKVVSFNRLSHLCCTHVLCCPVIGCYGGGRLQKDLHLVSFQRSSWKVFRPQF